MNSKTFISLIEFFKNSDSVNAIALGGSRSAQKAKPDSDYDIFIIIDSNKFETFLDSFPNKIEKEISEIIFMGKDKYLEDWGYMYCGIDDEGYFYDLALIPSVRTSEMRIRSNNSILYDKEEALANIIKNADDINYQSDLYLENKKPEVMRMVYINYVRYIKHFLKNDYWMAFRFLNLVRENVMKCERIKIKVPSKLFFLSEENYDQETKNTKLKGDFIIDGTFETLNETMKMLMSRYKLYFPNDDIIDKIESIYQFNKIDSIKKKLIHEMNPFYKISFDNLTVESIDKSEFEKSIKKRFRFHRHAKYSVKEIKLCDIKPLTKYVYRNRLNKAEVLYKKYIDYNINPYNPIFLNYQNEYCQLVSPPVLELHNNNYVLCDGTHRVYFAMQKCLEKIICLVIENVDKPLPGDVNKWDNVNLLDNEVPVVENFINYRPEYLSGYTWIFNSSKTWFKISRTPNELLDEFSKL